MKPNSNWPPLNFQYAGPQDWYLAEDSVTGSVTWRATGPLEPKQQVFIGTMYLQMSNCALKVTANAKGNDSGLLLWGQSPTAGWRADAVPNRFDGVQFADQGLVFVVTAHSPELGSHHAGPHAWDIYLMSPKKTEGNIMIQAIYAHAPQQIPWQHRYGFIIGDTVSGYPEDPNKVEGSGPYCLKLCDKYGPKE